MLPLLAFITALIADEPNAASAPPSAQAFYSRALLVMSDVQEPPNVDYTLTGEGHGLSVHLTSRDHLVWLAIGTGSDTTHWDVQHRTFDYESALTDESGTHWVSQRSFFDPTWYGSYRALRDGMLDYQDVEKPVAPKSTPNPDAVKLRTIAVISVMGTGKYAVIDRGAATCPSGSPGHALHLVARDHDPQHQLSDVVVDLASMRFCMIRYGEPSALGFSGYVEQHYAEAGGYWVETGGLIDGSLRVAGISLHHGEWTYEIHATTYPSVLPDSVFAIPATQ